MLFSSSFATAQTALVKPKVTVKSTPKTDLKRPHIFKVRGTMAPTAKVVKCASGVTNPAYCSPAKPADVCTGKVRITIKRGLLTIARSTIKLKADCAYSAKITIRKKMKHGKLTVTSRFMGNKYVGARNSSALKLKV
jgi:hypothetical protein